jgi:hypothetical protein
MPRRRATSPERSFADRQSQSTAGQDLPNRASIRSPTAPSATTMRAAQLVTRMASSGRFRPADTARRGPSAARSRAGLRMPPSPRSCSSPVPRPTAVSSAQSESACRTARGDRAGRRPAGRFPPRAPSPRRGTNPRSAPIELSQTAMYQWMVHADTARDRRARNEITAHTTAPGTSTNAAIAYATRTPSPEAVSVSNHASTHSRTAALRLAWITT